MRKAEMRPAAEAEQERPAPRRRAEDTDSPLEQLEEMANNSPRVRQLARMRSLLDAGAPVQRYYVQNPRTEAIRWEEGEPIPAAYTFQSLFQGDHGIDSLCLDSSVLDEEEEPEEQEAEEEQEEREPERREGKEGKRERASAAASSSMSSGEEQPLSLDEMATMSDLMSALRVDLSRFQIPSSVKPPKGGPGKEVARKMGDFNAMLAKLGQQPLFAKPFAVTVQVGDLKGFGDITAGAKLARQLSLFFGQIREWRDVQVRLYLQKLVNLEEEKGGGSVELTKAAGLARELLAGSEAVLDEGGGGASSSSFPEVAFGYPATNVGGVSFTVSQYGYDQLSSEFNQYGSGPGFGALGVLPVGDEQAEGAIRDLDEPGGDALATVELLKRKFDVESFHFGYFSIYKDRPKQFVNSILKDSKASRIGFALSKSADNLATLANTLSTSGYFVRLAIVQRDGGAKVSDHPPSKRGNGKEVLLVDLAEGVTNRNMLSLYYASDSPVGATGDQSFMEAYSMRSRKQERGAGPAGSLLYDVTDQQVGLYREMEELESGVVNPGKTPGKGLKALPVKLEIYALMQEKNLLFPIVMLINQALNEQYAS